MDTSRPWRTPLPIRMRRSRRDPFWEMNGPAARREHLRSTLRGWIAFSYAFLAAGCAAAAWGIQLGVAHVSGIRLLVLH